MKPVEVPPEVLAQRCEDRSNGNWFRLPDGSPDPLWEALRERCGKYMQEKNIDRTMSWGCYSFHVFLLAIQPVLFYYGYLATYPWTSHGVAAVMGVTTWIAGRLGHDIGHFAVSKASRPYQPSYVWQHIVANWAGWGLTNVGYWEMLHTFLHHADTNMDTDPDLYHYVFFLRDVPSYPHSILHRLQVHRLWCYIVWSATTAGLLLLEPMNVLLFGAGTVPTKPFQNVKFRPLMYVRMVAHLILFPAVYLALPIYLKWDSEPSKIYVVWVRFASFMVYLFASGFFFGIFSQVNHFSKDCVEAAHRNTSWAQRQIETAANFSVGSWFWGTLSAGINVQIEHHVFPHISSDKVHLLIPVVKEVCKEHGVEYKDYPTFLSILKSTHEYLDSLAAPVSANNKPAEPAVN
jgi:linoleoyl-CoA desaturase